jgi:hypothetical protein
MKLTIPEELQNSFAMLMKAFPAELQNDDDFKDTTLIYLKLGGMTLARNYIDITKQYLNNDPLDTGQGLRFPKIVEPKSDDDQADDEDENEDEDDASDDDATLSDEDE